MYTYIIDTYHAYRFIVTVARHKRHDYVGKFSETDLKMHVRQQVCSDHWSQYVLKIFQCAIYISLECHFKQDIITKLFERLS